MIRVKDMDQLELPGLEIWRQQYSSAKLKLLEKSWADIFRKFVLPELPIHKIMKLYKKGGRPTKELYAIAGTTILQQFFNLTDKETIAELAFNQQWHFALECFNESDQIISLRTLWTMRHHLVKLDLASEAFQKATDKMVSFFDVDTTKQRLDSVHVYSNMARLGRIRLMENTIIKFLKNLKRKDSELFKSTISDEIKDRYFSSKKGNYFGQIKPSETENTLKSLAELMNELLLKFEKIELVQTMNSYKLMKKVFSEQCEINEDKVVVVKLAKEVKADSIQNPSDPDAGYDAHKGQGFQTQIAETYSEQKETPDKQTLNLITYVATESAAIHDSHALEPALKTLEERNIDCKEILADTLYGSQANVEKALKNNINLIAPASGKKSLKGFESFKINFKTNEIESCPNGIKPIEIRYTKKLRYVAIWKDSICKNCPLLEQCSTQKGKDIRKIYYSKEELLLYQRRVYEDSPEFKEKYRYRSGIEATNSRFIGMTGARRSRYRGLQKMQFSQTLKALAINVFRIVSSAKAKDFIIYLFRFFEILDLYRVRKMKNQEFLGWNFS